MEFCIKSTWSWSAPCYYPSSNSYPCHIVVEIHRCAAYLRIRMQDLGTGLFLSGALCHSIPPVRKLKLPHRITSTGASLESFSRPVRLTPLNRFGSYKYQCWSPSLGRLGSPECLSNSIHPSVLSSWVPPSPRLSTANKAIAGTLRLQRGVGIKAFTDGGYTSVTR